MAEHSAIEWTDHTFNIAWGCVKVSPGCQHCYADTLSKRYGHNVWGPAKTTARRTFDEQHWSEPLKWNRDALRAGVRRRVFCSSMADVFEDHPTIDAERAKLWPVIRETPWLDWQLLTKRPERIAAHLPADWGAGYPNVWLGTSVESQPYAEERVPALLDVPAVVHFLSCEPLLGAVRLRWRWLRYANPMAPSLAHPDRRIDWVIVGGESGAGARAMDPAWAASLRDQCIATDVAFFLKQLGGVRDKRGGDAALLDGARWTQMPAMPVERAA